MSASIVPSTPAEAAAPTEGVGDLKRIFERQLEAFNADPTPGREARDSRLAALQSLLRENMDRIVEAVDQDFGGRSRDETRLVDIFPSLEGIKYARWHLKSWMKPERRPVSIWFKPGRARVVWQPLGVVGIIVPWNYPIFLSVGPLVGALAAGNRAMLKMSEFTPRTGALLAELVARYFKDDQVTVVNGDAAVARAFASLPFNHLLFTGSTAVGRSVMRAAAENLTPVTLELGGKSPTILGSDFPVAAAARRIMHGKCMNAGQTCVAPDYVMIPSGCKEEFVRAARAAVTQMYPSLRDNTDYGNVVNERHYRRLLSYLEDARAKGAEIIEINPASESLEGTHKIAPTLLFGVKDDMRIMLEEIFGPLLPVLVYQELGEAIRYVNEHPRPLALYYFGYDKNRIEQVLARTISGGVTLNETTFHVAQEGLPFGGVGPSGMGQYHGRDGFETFSKPKAVLRPPRISGVALLRPPFGRRFRALVKLMLR